MLSGHEEHFGNVYSYIVTEVTHRDKTFYRMTIRKNNHHCQIDLPTCCLEMIMETIPEIILEELL